MWAAGHDLWSPNYLPPAQSSWSSTRTRCCDRLQRVDRRCGGALEPGVRLDGHARLDPIARYATVLWGNTHPIYAMMRRDCLHGLRLCTTVGTDNILLAHLALRGDFLHAPDAVWQRREFRNETSYAAKLQRYGSAEARLSAGRLARLFPWRGCRGS